MTPIKHQPDNLAIFVMGAWFLVIGMVIVAVILSNLHHIPLNVKEILPW